MAILVDMNIDRVKFMENMVKGYFDQGVLMIKDTEGTTALAIELNKKSVRTTHFKSFKEAINYLKEQNKGEKK